MERSARGWARFFVTERAGGFAQMEVCCLGVPAGDRCLTLGEEVANLRVAHCGYDREAESDARSVAGAGA